ncbi:MAG: HAD family hydrolase [Cyclobacteriaceae bacterium]
MYSKKLVVCDVCDTLYRSNTTFDFIRFIANEGSIFRLFVFNLLTQKWSPIFLALVILGRLKGMDYNRKLALKFFSGFGEQQLAIASEKFYSDFLALRKNEKIFDLLARYRNSAKLILASSSIHPVVQVIATENDFDDFIASTMESKQGKYTGALTQDLTGRKQSFIRELMDREGANELIVITDNKSDKALVKMSNESFIVVKKESDKNFWKGIDTNFIMIS